MHQSLLLLVLVLQCVPVSILKTELLYTLGVVVTSPYYLDNIINPVIVYEQHRTNFIFMGNNAPSH